ncbi:hypothetical protein [Mycolicibacterium canariasense]|nr:hypothetical protein [Mycolicibacterium canariasense]MCV7207039.1 hypothetical protein [Mycolicibacterium canariasense]ORV05613.1 hypothetical protein AWB94_19725 [Mycolicibacterium canariasense]
MTLLASRHRAEQAYLLREVEQKTWAEIRDALKFKSTGAAQNAHKRHLARNPLPNAAGAAVGIVERKRHVLGVAVEALDKAFDRGDYRTVAQLTDAITRADAEFAKLYGLGSENVNVKIQRSPTEIIEEMRAALHRQIEEREQKAIGQ